MTQEVFFVVTVAVIFILSLAGAFVLFKFLKSSALIKSPSYQAGGALAGFLLIYGALYYSLDHLLANVAAWKPIPWTISGTAQLEAVTKHDGIAVKYIPPEPTTYTNVGGLFRLDNVRVIKSEGFPDLLIEKEGYYPIPYHIDEKSAEIDENRKKITLKEGAIKLSKIKE